jgi:hypothetical protein
MRVNATYMRILTGKFRRSELANVKGSISAVALPLLTQEQGLKIYCEEAIVRGGCGICLGCKISSHRRDVLLMQSPMMKRQAGGK